MPAAVISGVAFVAKLVAAKGLAAVTAAAAFKAFATGAVIGFFTSTLMREFAKKPSRPNSADASAGVAGSTRGLTGTVIPKRWILGRARVSGGLLWLEDRDNYSYEVRVLSEGSIDAIERVWVHGEEVEMERNGNVLTPVEGSRYWGEREDGYVIEYYYVEEGYRDNFGEGPPSRESPAHEVSGTNEVASTGQPGGGVSGAQSAGVSGQQGGGGEGGGRNFDETSPRPPGRTDSGTRVRKERRVPRIVRVPLIKITEYFRADGTEGAEIREIASDTDNELGLPWTAEHKCNGFSYILVELYQPDYGDEIDDRFYPTRPDLNFLVRGLKVRYPVADMNAPNNRRLTAPAWTRNAAILRYWYLTERRNVDPLLIDIDYFTAARLVCDEDLQLTEQSGYHMQYPETVKRYTIDGAITSGDSAASVDAQFDFAWQGFVVESSGNLLFRPGTDLESRFTISEDDIIAEPVVRPFGRRSDLANEVSLTIEQSSGNEYLPEDFKVIDSVAQNADGERLPQELSDMKFVTEPVQAVNLLHQRLRQQRGLVTLELHVKSPPDWRYLQLVAGDKITVRLPEFGIGIEGARLRDFRVTGVQVNDNYTANLTLLEWPDGLFSDQFDFPPRQQRFAYPVPILPAPIGQGDIDWNIDESNGSVVWTAFLSWAATPYETVVSAASRITNTEIKVTRANYVDFQLTEAGRYTFNLRHRSRDGRSSAQSQVVLDATFADIPLPRPVVIDAVQNSNIIVFRVENVPNRDITGLEIRYRSLGLDASFADIAVITESNWEEALQLNVSPVVPPNADDPIFAYAVLPASGTYKLYVRLRNRVGNLSPISNVVDARFEIPASATGSQAAQPLWQGNHNNTIVWSHDGESRVYADRGVLPTAVTKEQWAGAEDFPFGEHTGFGNDSTATTSTSYLTRPYTFDEVQRREIFISIETDTPPGKVASAPDGFELVLRYKQGSATATTQSQIVADGASIIVERLAWVQALIVWNDQRNHALTTATVGWRDIE